MDFPGPFVKWTCENSFCFLEFHRYATSTSDSWLEELEASPLPSSGSELSSKRSDRDAEEEEQPNESE
jgi:hypothetical protein